VFGRGTSRGCEGIELHLVIVVARVQGIEIGDADCSITATSCRRSPPCSAISNRSSAAVCHCASSCSAFGNALM
jgi:hypothetical protein